MKVLCYDYAKMFILPNKQEISNVYVKYSHCSAALCKYKIPKTNLDVFGKIFMHWDRQFD